MVKASILFFAIVLLIPLAAASDVAYIYDNEARIDRNIINVFSELGLTVDKISIKSLPDLSQYKFIFLGDEKIGENIPINKYPSIVAGYYLGEKTGLTDKDGTSKLASTMPLKVNFKGSEIQVYTSGRDERGIAIPYYFLDNENKAPGLTKYAGTYSTSSGKDFGDVISFAGTGDFLYTGEEVESGICFFGIVKSNYWTPEAKNLFLDCIKYVYDYTPKEDITCSQNQDCVMFSILDSQPFCEGNNVVQNFTTPVCINPGTAESYCAYQEVTHVLEQCAFCVDGSCGEPECNSNEDCDDGFLFTEDICISPGTENSECKNDFKNNLEIITVVASSSPNSIILNFYHNYSDLSGIKGYYLSENGINWTFLELSNSTYKFTNLKPSTDYVFTVQIVDYFDFILQELIVNVKTSALPEVRVVQASGGGGGGACLTKWECSEWEACIKNSQSRVCSYPEGNCKPIKEKPEETQECISPPIPEPSQIQEPVVPKDNPPVIQETNVPPITGAAVSIPDILASDGAILTAAVLLMGLITTYFLIATPKK